MGAAPWGHVALPTWVERGAEWERGGRAGTLVPTGHGCVGVAGGGGYAGAPPSKDRWGERKSLRWSFSAC